MLQASARGWVQEILPMHNTMVYDMRLADDSVRQQGVLSHVTPSLAMRGAESSREEGPKANTSRTSADGIVPADQTVSAELNVASVLRDCRGKDFEGDLLAVCTFTGSAVHSGIRFEYGPHLERETLGGWVGVGALPQSLALINPQNKSRHRSQPDSILGNCPAPTAVGWVVAWGPSSCLGVCHPPGPKPTRRFVPPV